MRNSINYNLKYFIMKTSGTKPMKNTMRKPSPLKFDFISATSKAATPAPGGKPNATISKAASIAKDKKETTTKSTPTTKPARPAVKKASATVKKAAGAATKGTVKSALMQMKKNKC